MGALAWFYNRRRSPGAGEGRARRWQVVSSAVWWWAKAPFETVLWRGWVSAEYNAACCHW